MILSRNRIAILACIALAGTSALAACSDTQQAEREVRSADRPATILCQGYNGVIFSGRSTGRIEFDPTGRITFVDATTGAYTVTEGECIVQYDTDQGPTLNRFAPAALAQGATVGEQPTN